MQFKRPDTLEHAIYETIRYSDLFEFPMTAVEITRYLIGWKADVPSVQLTLKEMVANSSGIYYQDGMYFLKHKDWLVLQRYEKEQRAERLWNRAIRYGRWIAHIPFVRMVAITGSLTSSNVEVGADIDYMVITAPSHLWLCRAMILLLSRAVAPLGSKICPNYLITTKVLALAERDIYAAQELVRMIPLSGRNIYQLIMEKNRWAEIILPNAFDALNAPLVKDPVIRPLQWFFEPLLRSKPGQLLESWEMHRKIARFSSQVINSEEVYFSADHCKGHFDRHAERTLAAYNSVQAAKR